MSSVVMEVEPFDFRAAVREADAEFGTAPKVQPPIAATPFVWSDPSTLAVRQWIYAHHLIRKRVSVDVAAGGIGKSSKMIVVAIALAAGKNLLGKNPECKQFRVWLYNLEDDREEIYRRVHAAMQHYGLTAEDVGDRLYIDSGLDQPLVIAKTTSTDTVILAPKQELIDQIIERQIDLLIVDPFVSSHAVSENDNTAIDAVMKQGWVQVAYHGDCSVNLVHHIRKSNGEEANEDSVRGASAIIGAARSVQVYNRMTKEEGDLAQVDNHKRFFSITLAKANLAPPLEARDWYQMIGVELPNGEKVGVATAWQWPNSFDQITPDDVHRILRRLENEPETWKMDVRSPNWVGKLIGEELDLDAKTADGRQEIKSLLRIWIKNDVIKAVKGIDKQRKRADFAAPGSSKPSLTGQ